MRERVESVSVEIAFNLGFARIEIKHSWVKGFYGNNSDRYLLYT
jgi:hypothetical protein